MSTTQHYIREYEWQHSRFEIDGHPETREGYYDLRFRYRPEGQWQSHLAIYVPEPVRPAVESNTARVFYLETGLENSVTSKHLPHYPSRVLFGVKTTDEQVHACVPQSVVHAYRLHEWGGLATILAGVALLFTTHTWLGALLLVAGTHAMRTASGMPHENMVRSDLAEPTPRAQTR